MNTLKHFILLTALTLSTMTLKAQSTGEYQLMGLIFEQVSEKIAKPIPFATVYYYDNHNREQLEYIRYTDMIGSYNLGTEVPLKEYYVVIEAPGYETKTKAVGNFSSRQGNRTLHYALKPLNNIQAYNLTLFNPDKLVERPKKFLEYLYAMPNINIDEQGNITTKSGEAIRVYVNGKIPQLSSFDDLNLIPYRKVNVIQYFELNEGYREYRAAINIVLGRGDNTGIMLRYENDFMPIELKRYALD